MDQEINKKVDGKKLAKEILDTLKPRISVLKKRKVTPTLAVIQVGNDPGSESYIRMKRKAAKKIGASVLVRHFPTSVFFQEMAEAIQGFNADRSVHGIIIQRPLPPMLQTNAFNTAIDFQKDIDGFRAKTTFRPPIALAIFHILRFVYELKNVTTHLKSKQIVILGRGETAGKPIADMMADKKIAFIQCHSQTTNMHEFTQEADIIISCVGRQRVVAPDMIKEGAVLIGVGIERDKKGKLHGDYNEQEIAEKASFYTPTPGGVGPVNVAYLMSNLVTAAEKGK
ncbi:MAG: bifunctional 5,10-methylenetetrahydrofolate dehydrogenase/5,10-methenyltetrahydrofolate cyclohydrolase [Candidatus Roizmanbacteria bacterium]|nr:bifunctional 5,10-methylenetetrahydrofolate dehydrogenase/5,10-methenyltetrahydrofolate cyclohydrolase [Candidatus Roizmanbacteria bacterium]